MYTLVLITSLMGQFHHDLNIQPPIPGFTSEQLCIDAGNDILKSYLQYNKKVDATIKCVNVK